LSVDYGYLKVIHVDLSKNIDQKIITPELEVKTVLISASRMLLVCDICDKRLREK